MYSYRYVTTGSSITVTGKGRTVTIQDDAPNYKHLKEALRSGRDEEVEKYLDFKSTIEAWSKGSFKFEGDEVTYKGERIPGDLGRRISAMAAKGEDPAPLMKFWEKLQKNPSWRSVEQLFPFLNHQGIPIIANGNFLAYKGVNYNYTDKHTGRVDNKPGTVNEMPRNKISDDPDVACHYGFHVGALGYARSFASVTVVCEVDPADVVCIPKDSSQQKMRVSKYRVRGNHNGELLPSTTYNLEADLGTGAEVEQEQEEFDLDIEETEPEEAKTAKAASKKAPKKKKKSPKEKRLKVKRAADKQAKLKVASKYRKIHEEDRRQLLDETIMDLREYATQVLHIVGASKIPGGKVPLVQQILKVRRNFS